MASELVIKLMFEQTYSSCAIKCFCLRWCNQRLRRESNFVFFCIFNYVTCMYIYIYIYIYICMYILIPLIFLSVNFGLPGEKLVTIWCAIKWWKNLIYCARNLNKHVSNFKFLSFNSTIVKVRVYESISWFLFEFLYF